MRAFQQSTLLVSDIALRQDAYTRAHPMKVEVEKSEKERDHYLRPELFDQPEEKSVEWGASRSL